jgi:hypothetical protein
MLDTIVVSVALSYLLVVWFRTNAFSEYMTLFRLDRFFQISKYNELHSNGYDGSYSDFLYEYFKNFFIVRLVTCPVCVSFWLGVVVLLTHQNMYDVLVAPLTLFLYLVYNRLL